MAVDPGEPLGIDPDVDLADPAQRAELDVHPLRLLAVIAAGGVVGSEARYTLTLELPDAARGVPWTTFAVNVLGCLAIGALMAGVRRWGARRPLLRPFAGVGVLGGFTTFSAYAVGVDRLLASGRPLPAIAYLVLTPVAAVAAAVLGERAVERFS
jgi:CrcB protein